MESNKPNLEIQIQKQYSTTELFRQLVHKRTSRTRNNKRTSSTRLQHNRRTKQRHRIRYRMVQSQRNKLGTLQKRLKPGKSNKSSPKLVCSDSCISQNKQDHSQIYDQRHSQHNPYAIIPSNMEGHPNYMDRKTRQRCITYREPTTNLEEPGFKAHLNALQEQLSDALTSKFLVWWVP